MAFDPAAICMSDGTAMKIARINKANAARWISRCSISGPNWAQLWDGLIR
jgi:hypothetical protein